MLRGLYQSRVTKQRTVNWPIELEFDSPSVGTTDKAATICRKQQQLVIRLKTKRKGVPFVNIILIIKSVSNSKQHRR